MLKMLLLLHAGCWEQGMKWVVLGEWGSEEKLIWNSQQSFMLQCIQIYSSVGRPIIVQAMGEALL